RAVEQSEQLVQALREQGAIPIVLPMVAFGPPEDPSLLDEAIRHFRSYDWVFLTSQNALRALEERCQFLKLSLTKALEGMSIAAVGPATADAAQNAGLRVSYVATKHQGVALAEELAERVRGKRVLLPRSDRANPELVESLHRFGAHVVEVCAYRTVRSEKTDSAAAGALAEQGADAVLFFSPSAVHHLQELLGSEKFLAWSRRSVYAAIGPVTEGALRKMHVDRVVLARDTTVPAVLEALSDYFAHASSGLSAGVKPG
ncbi:MAG TPA: uroporphyrinogen-III synthase, partial [Candidatus Sulfotelmatobacter sp.]|nr:uroporphyrinogen-III synthase [Candidatus Sulfotelmatobacter sp.]